MTTKVILGSTGWIGSSLANYLRAKGQSPLLIDRNNIDDWIESEAAVDEVFYCIGLTADFRKFPYETVDAHVNLLMRIVRNKKLKKLLYLSSTRVYQKSNSSSEEDMLTMNSNDPGDLYNISKLMGESLVLNDSRNGFRVARISNVVGPSQPSATFIGSLLNESSLNSKVIIRQHQDCAKDYIHLSEVARYLDCISHSGKFRIYNVASGCQSSHLQVAQWLRQKGIIVEFARNPGKAIIFPPINVDRIRGEFGPSFSPLTSTAF
ncbi:NAD-dependent epimerase/dehydratase family protein [Synechococcus sp. MIT S9452]|uniref:NAD-dependent epimerase/dehydratase family protein n=1 Tax=Synechococcus sp. MIT S9452 TaxID=3082546 RepID=UPI0039A55995